MGTYSNTEAVKKIYDSGLKMFTGRALADLVGKERGQDLVRAVKRLVKAGVLEKLERDKYVLAGFRPEMFEMARFLYQPSYISFETALNHWGILSQFPYEVTSATVKKPVVKKVEGKVFSYSHVKQDLFFGYEKQGDGMLAMPEKALLDQVYLYTKGLKGLTIDEYDLERIDKKRLFEYGVKYPNYTQMRSLIGI